MGSIHSTAQKRGSMKKEFMPQEWQKLKHDSSACQRGQGSVHRTAGGITWSLRWVLQYLQNTAQSYMHKTLIASSSVKAWSGGPPRPFPQQERDDQPGMEQYRSESGAAYGKQHHTAALSRRKEAHTV